VSKAFQRLALSSPSDSRTEHCDLRSSRTGGADASDPPPPEALHRSYVGRCRAALGQRIGKSSWLGELENVSLGHGVTFLRWIRGGEAERHAQITAGGLLPES
jgi:hypothetical protein